MRLVLSLTAIGAVLFALFNNCSAGSFKSAQGSSSEDTYGLSKIRCSDRDERAANRIYVLSANEYVNIAEDLFPAAKISDLVSQTSGLPVTPDQFEGNLELQKQSGFILDRMGIINFFAANLEVQARTDCGGILDAKCRDKVVRTYLYKIQRRSISASAISTILNETKDLTFSHFIKFLFLTPEFHFKIYSNPMTSYEFAVKLAMTLSGSFPDDELIAKHSSLIGNRDAIRGEILRILSNPKNLRRFSSRFWGRWTNVHRLLGFSLPTGTPFDLKKQHDDFLTKIEAALLSDQRLSELFYSANGKEVPDSLLSHPAFTMVTSRVMGTEIRSNYVQRGVNVASRLLCIEMPSLPEATSQEIAQAQDEARNMSALEAINFHRAKPQCAACHDVIDPIGVSMERLDPFGNYRVEFHDGSPIHSEGTILGRRYGNLNSMVRAVAESPDLAKCYVQNLRAFVDGPEAERVGACDGEVHIEESPNTSMLDTLTDILASPRFFERFSTPKQAMWAQRKRLVTHLYGTGLRRNQWADSEIEYWLDVYQASGYVAVIEGIFLSAEMSKSTPTSEAFVDRLYIVLIGRAPTSEQLQSGVSAVNAKSRKAYISIFLTQSPFTTETKAIWE